MKSELWSKFDNLALGLLTIHHSSLASILYTIAVAPQQTELHTNIAHCQDLYVCPRVELLHEECAHFQTEIKFI